MEDLGRVSVNNVKTMVLGVAFDLIFLSQIISLFSGGEQKKAARISSWWFQTFFIFIPTWGIDPI